MGEPIRDNIGPFTFEWSPWADARNGISLVYKGRKVRVTFLEDGRVRFRIDKAGPMVLTECYLTGKQQDILAAFAPEGWVKTRPTNTYPATHDATPELDGNR